MAKYREETLNRDRRDGLKINRVHDNYIVSRHTHGFSIFDIDNIVTGRPGGGFRQASIAKQLRKLNYYKCRKLNGYNGKLDGRD